MPIDWDQFGKDIDSIIGGGAQRADERLAGRISSVTRMTDEEVRELFPKPADAQKLAELLKVVHSADERNTKINTIVSNAEEFGDIILTLPETFSQPPLPRAN